MYTNERTRSLSKSFIILVVFTILEVILLSVVFYGLTQKYASSVNVNSYKKILNNSIPLIDNTYNSGKIKFSFGGELGNFITVVTGVNSSDPYDIINFKNPMMKYYYPIFLSNQYHEQDKENPDESADNSGEKYIIHRSEGNNALSISYVVDDIDHNESSIEHENENPSYAKGDVVIKNGSGLKIDLGKIISEPFNNKFIDSPGAQILLYHTHTTESYIKSIADFDDKSVTSFSTDKGKNVVRAGHELDKILTTEYNFKTIHNSSQHHYPSNKAYDNSRKTVQNIISGNPSVKLSIDIHRDGLSKEQGKLRLTQEVNGKDCAKLMFVVGTDENRSNPRWEDNLRLAILLQERLEQTAPGITRHISIRSGAYNQDIAENALLIEFGGDGNTLEEVSESCKYLAEAIDYVLGI